MKAGEGTDKGVKNYYSKYIQCQRDFWVKRLYPDQPVVGIGIVIVNQSKIILIQHGNEPSKGK